MMSLYLLQEHWIVNSIFESYAEEGRICALKREKRANVDWTGREEPDARYGCWPLGGGRGDNHMAISDFEKAISANGEGGACVEGSAAADGIFEDCRGECSSTRRRSWWMDGRKERENDSNGLLLG